MQLGNFLNAAVACGQATIRWKVGVSFYNLELKVDRSLETRSNETRDIACGLVWRAGSSRPLQRERVGEKVRLGACQRRRS